MLEVVLIDPGANKVVGLIPRPAFRDLFLCLEDNGAARICEPDVFLSRMSNGDNGKKGGLPSFAMSNGSGRKAAPVTDGLVETGESKTLPSHKILYLLAKRKALGVHIAGKGRCKVPGNFQLSHPRRRLWMRRSSYQ
ncbi:MAG: hypothetical protein HY686_01515 [Chloroflexi bacterium]|nr:hypothetical protein [Chloroflexota bacterium]